MAVAVLHREPWVCLEHWLQFRLHFCPSQVDVSLQPWLVTKKGCRLEFLSTNPDLFASLKS